MNKADIIDGYQKGYSDVAYAYLDEKDAKMSFYQLFSFASTTFRPATQNW